MYDNYDGIYAISCYLDNYFYESKELDKNIESNRKHLELLDILRSMYQFNKVHDFCRQFLTSDYYGECVNSEYELFLKDNGLLKHYIENNLLELFGNQVFLNIFNLLNNYNFSEDANKEKERDFIVEQFKLAILHELDKLNDNLDYNSDKKSVLEVVSVLLDGSTYKNCPVFELNIFFSKLKEKRSRY